MPVYDPQMTAQKAAETLPVDVDSCYVNATQRKKSGRVAPPELSVTKEFKQKRVRIFNVGPWSHIVPCGSAGTFFIPGHIDKKGSPLLKGATEMTTPLHVIEDELVISSEKEYKRLQDEGRHIASEIIGIGRGRDPRHALTHMGVFIAEGDQPTEADEEAARGEVHVYCMGLVEQMRSLWDLDRKLAYDVRNPRVHGIAARFLNLQNEPWQVKAAPEPIAKTKCPGCRAEVDMEAPKCMHCGGIVNEDAYVKWSLRQREIEAALAPSSPKGK
jgi:hypothetical protein